MGQSSKHGKTQAFGLRAKGQRGPHVPISVWPSLAQSVLMGVLLYELTRESILSLDIRALFNFRQKLNART